VFGLKLGLDNTGVAAVHGTALDAREFCYGNTHESWHKLRSCATIAYTK
jgi:hypothetical protein